MTGILVRALQVFCSSLFVHIIVWRCLPRKREARRLVVIFLVLPGIAVFLCALLPVLGYTVVDAMPWPAWVLVYLLEAALSISYLLLYTAVTGFSPSIAILEKVAASMPQGLPRHQLAPAWFTDETLSGARKQNLIGEGMVSESAGRLVLEPRGRLVAQGFLLFRRFLGLSAISKG